MWGYLTEFWNAITSVADYPIEFFKSIGNAVGGAIGKLFEDIIHHTTDVFHFLGWLVENVGVLFGLLLTPIQWVFGFLKSFIDSAFTSVLDVQIWAFTDDIMSVFDAIPYWSVLTGVLGTCLLFLIGIGVLKQFTRL